jgi:hypothetical protein
MFDHEEVFGHFCGFQPQAQLLLQRGIQRSKSRAWSSEAGFASGAAVFDIIRYPNAG